MGLLDEVGLYMTVTGGGWSPSLGNGTLLLFVQRESITMPSHHRY